MIKIKSLTVRNFRGIRSLTLELGGRNFAVCGPNGSGKSGVVDAIEFVLTGSISRLTGRGTGGLSVKEHGPHVDSKPDDSFVEARVFDPRTGCEATIRRTVKQPKALTMEPDHPVIRRVVAEAAAHPEFVLSRREIIKFILAEPATRSELVQALLRLDELETVRGVLRKIANAEERDVKTAARSVTEASADLSAALDVQALTPATILAAVNPRRSILGMDAIQELSATTSLRDGVSPAAGSSAPTVNKTQVLADLNTARDSLQALAMPEYATAVQSATESLTELVSDVALLEGANRESMLRTALALYEDSCPVCGTDFDIDEFQKTVTARLDALASATQRRQALEAQLDPIADAAARLASALKRAGIWSTIASPPVDVSGLLRVATAQETAAQALRKLLPIDAALEALTVVTVIATVSDALDRLDTAAALLPEPSKQEAARDFLVLAQTRLDTLRKQKQRQRASVARSGLAAAAVAAYGTAVTAALDGIFTAVQSRFSALYRAINREDEGAFEARLVQEPGRLTLDVDFYGRGHFPPGAYHSEGHQDGMGLCLYLALADHLLGKDFGIAVLDDVLMSVDAGHRREFSHLLKVEFPHTQFVLTTHDPIWLKHMTSEGLLDQKACANFRKWDVEQGPAEWDTKDIWAEIDRALEINDVPAAAAALRRFLEYFGEETCHRLRGRVEFRADAHFMLGDTLPHSVGALSGLLKSGRVAATKWKKPERAAELSALEEAFQKARTATNIDHWQVNTAVHYDAWKTLAKQDFAPVVAAYKTLVACFHCADCGGMLRVSPERGPKDAVRCACGTVQISLVEP